MKCVNFTNTLVSIRHIIYIDSFKHFWCYCHNSAMTMILATLFIHKMSSNKMWNT